MQMRGAARKSRKVPRVMTCACRRMAGSATDQVAVTPEMNFPRSAHLHAREGRHRSPRQPGGKRK